MPKKQTTYKESGVDILKEGEAIEEIWKLVPETFKVNPNVKFLPALSHYGGIVDIGMANKYLVVTVDGVGSKVLIAEMLEKYDTVGIDCIAMNVNDLICVGAEPLVFVDYLAIQKPNKEMFNELTKGLVKGAVQSKMAIIGGETATLPDIIKGKEGKGFDLAGTAIGQVDKDKVVLGNQVKKGDIVYGIESNGLHSNGFTLVRKVLLEKYDITETIQNISLQEELIRPTMIYVQEILEILEKAKVHGLANITGGAFMKLARLTRQTKKPLGILLDTLPEPLPIFKLIQEEGNISDKEMYKTFNMGVGFCIIAPESEHQKLEKICQKHQKKLYKIGSITESEKIVIHINGKEIIYPTDKF
ncbi:MAG: phosphoribosylformylglycinamidine cyclo-ligase [Asgard group archaeon]|nr:phosphoribosylformylglycinamidine cyclo-ligase [Asgard group archaeon]